MHVPLWQILKFVWKLLQWLCSGVVCHICHINKQNCRGKLKNSFNCGLATHKTCKTAIYLFQDQFIMTEFRASLVAFEVQKSFANKFFSNKTVAKSLIDDTSSHLLDNLYLLLYVFVSIQKHFKYIDTTSKQQKHNAFHLCF